MGSTDGAQRRPWLALAFAGKVVADAAGALLLTAEQASKHRRFGYCLTASACSVAAVPLVMHETAAAMKAIGHR